LRHSGSRDARAGIENALWDIEASKKISLISQLLAARIGNQMRCLLRAAATPKCFSKKSPLSFHAGYSASNSSQTGQRSRGCTRLRTPIQHPLSVDANSAYTLAELEHLKRFDDLTFLMMEQAALVG